MSDLPSEVGGRGWLIPEELVEVGAERFYDADDAYPEKWEYQTEDVKDWYRDKFRVGLAAVLSRLLEGAEPWWVCEEHQSRSWSSTGSCEAALLITQYEIPKACRIVERQLLPAKETP